MYRVVARTTRRHSSLISKIKLAAYIAGTLIGVFALDNIATPFWPCAVLICAGSLLTYRTVKDMCNA